MYICLIIIITYYFRKDEKEKKKKEIEMQRSSWKLQVCCARSSRSPDAEFRVKVSPRVPRESDISLTFVRNPFRFARIFCDHVRGSHRAAISRRSLQKLCGRPLEGGQRGADRDSWPVALFVLEYLCLATVQRSASHHRPAWEFAEKRKIKRRINERKNRAIAFRSILTWHRSISSLRATT